MSQEYFLRLCELGVLKTEVYVCGWGWTAPETVIYGSSGSSSSGSSGWSGSSGSSGWCGTSGSSGSGSGGGVSGGGYGWENWPEWYGWNNFSGSSWNDIYGSGLSDEQKMERLNSAKARAVSAFGRNFPVRLAKSDELCKANAKYENGEIVVCNSFFTYSSGDQASILWHEFYHMQHDHNGYAQHMGGDTILGQDFLLMPGDELMNCLRNIFEYKYEGLTPPITPEGMNAILNDELTISSLHPAQWYRNEVETYKAEIRNSIYKSERYLCEMRWLLWKYERLLTEAEKYE